MKTSKNKDLRSLNTFGLKASAALYVGYDSPADLISLDWDSLPQPVLPVGQGANLLFTGDFPGTVLHSRIKGIDVDEDRSMDDDVFVHVGAGVVLDDFCEWAARKELWGPENLSAIPGTVGAAPVQNVGAYGVEAGEIIDSVECFEIATRSFVTLTPTQCEFAYRDSFFKHNRGRYIVVGVVFHLHRDLRPQLDYGNLRSEVERNIENFRPLNDPYQPILQSAFNLTPTMPLSPMLVRNTVIVIREGKLPNPRKVGSAGSFFKNPVVSEADFDRVQAVVRSQRGEDAMVPHYELEGGMVKIPAAYLIEYCGFKGVRHGGAGTWPVQPLVIVNASGKATSSEILELEKMIIDKVQQTFGIELSAEVDHI